MSVDVTLTDREAELLARAAGEKAQSAAVDSGDAETLREMADTLRRATGP